MVISRPTTLIVCILALLYGIPLAEGIPHCTDPPEAWPEWQKPDPRGMVPLYDRECEAAIGAFEATIQGIEMLSRTFKSEAYGVSPDHSWEDTPRAYYDGELG